MSPETLSLRALRWLTLGAVVLAFYYNLHAIPLFDLDEGAFSEATREMFLRGDFISTFLNGVPRYDKPILIYWLQALSIAGLGLNEFALRLPSALAASAWVGVVVWVVKGLKGERTALWSGLLMASSLEIPIMGKAATADALLNLWITAAMLLAYRYHVLGRRRDLYLTYACMGLGLLTKGPVAVLIPFIVTGMFYASLGQWRAWLRVVTHPGGLALMAVIALPWYVAQYLKEGQAFIDGFFLKHNLDRFSSPMEKHGGGLFYYVPVVLLGVLPYTVLLIQTGLRLRVWWRDPLARYCLLWSGFVFVFFSLSGTKLPHYVVYGYAALFILMALALERLTATRWLYVPALLFFVTLLLLPELIAVALPHVRDAHVRVMLMDYEVYVGAAYRLYFAAATLVTVYFIWERRLARELKLLVLGLGTVWAVSTYLVPAVAALQQSPIKEAARLARDAPGPLVIWRLQAPSFNVYTQRLSERRDPRPGDLVLTKAIYLAELGHVEERYRKHGIVLVRMLPSP